MKTLLRFFSIFFLMMSLGMPKHDLYAGPGDTTIVQAFTFNTPGSPKEGWFEFPSDSLDYEKILMYYTLKCDPSQNPPCGEWDYLTYTKLYEHTAEYDSTLLYHPSFIVQGVDRDTVQYSMSPYYQQMPWWMYSLDVSDTLSMYADTLGQGNFHNQEVLRANDGDHSVQYLWRAGELLNAGFSAGPVSGMWVDIKSGNAQINQMKIFGKQAADTVLYPVAVDNSGFQKLLHASFAVNSSGWHYLRFSQALQWDGQSNIVLKMSHQGIQGTDLVLAADSISGRGISSSYQDTYLDFQEGDYIDVGDLNALDSTQQFTFETYARIDHLNTWTKLFFKGTDVQHRIGIEYGPSSYNKASLYLLAGNGSNAYGHTGQIFDRGKWYHITMVYDGTQSANVTRLKLYINGQQVGLNYNSTIPAYTVSNSESLIIASKDRFDGGIDNVRIWGRALSASEIQSRYDQNTDPGDPYYSDLLLDYRMDDPGSLHVVDSGLYQNHGIRAFPNYQTYQGRHISRYGADAYRPAVIFEQAAYSAVLDSVLMMDSIKAPHSMIIFYSDSSQAVIPSDTVYAYISDWVYQYSNNGTVQDSVWYAGDTTIIRKQWAYYDTPYEIVNTWEIGRFITPYGYGIDLGSGWTWVYDVTDYEPLLHDSVHLSSGNWQELHDLKFAFIEGTPAREVVDIQKLHSGTHRLSTLDSTMAPVNIQPDAAAQMWRLKTRVTGHRFDNPTNCAEFCPKQHYVKINGVTHWDWQIIQECADNPLYPQGGTWIYDRAGWCPGDKATTRNFELTPYVNANGFTVDYDTDADPYGEYVVETQLVSYGAANFSRDAGINQIVAPNSWEIKNRFNPICSQPVIEIENRGLDTLQQLDIHYGLPGDSVYQYTWNGSLPFAETREISLPPMDFDTPYASAKRFFASVQNPNGQNDQYPYNDTAYSNFELVPEYDVPLVVYFMSNNNPHENEWEVIDEQGDVVFQRANFAPQTISIDTLNLGPGCYELILRDFDDDGISFWANNETSGYMRIRKLGGAYVKMMEGDFGKSIRYVFRYGQDVGVESATKVPINIEVFPNPASRYLNIKLNQLPQEHVHIDLYDSMGRKIISKTVDIHQDRSIQRLDVQGLENGIYMLKLVSGDAVYTKKVLIHFMAGSQPE